VSTKCCPIILKQVVHTAVASVISSFLTFLLSPSLFYLLVHSRCPGFFISFDHTQAHTTVGRTPLDEGSAGRRDFYLTTQTLYKTNIHAPGGIRTHDTSKRSAADVRLRPCGSVWFNGLNIATYPTVSPSSDL
jgi:hypothetical protein